MAEAGRQQQKERWQTIKHKSNDDVNILFEQQQLNQAFLWISSWNEEQISSAISECIKHCSCKTKRFLSTILEPLLHRDFIYNKFDTNHHGSFSYLSTFITRELRSKLEKEVIKSHRVRNKVCRLKSAYVKSEIDVTNWSNQSILPSLKPIQTEEPIAAPILCYNKKPQSNCSPDQFLLRKNKSFHDISDSKYTVNIHRHDSNPTSNENVSTQFDHDKSANVEVERVQGSPTISRKFNRLYMFQSPSRCTALRRSKTQPHAAVKSAPAAIRLFKSADTLDDYNIFKSFPESLKTKKRYMQHDLYGSNVNCSNNGKCYRGRNFLPSLTHPNQIQKVLQPKTFTTEMSQVFLWFAVWEDREQEEFMQNFLRLLTPTQLYFMYASIMIRLYCDFISQLPEIIAFQILSYFKPKQIQACAKVCRSWKLLCTHDVLWKDICKKKNIKISKGALSYMELYLQYKLIKTNWSEGRYRISEHFHHNQSSVTCLDILDKTLATGCVDKCIRVWKFDQKRHTTLEGHQRTIWSVIFISNNLLLSCSNDHTIKFWNIVTGKCIRTIVGHEGAVWCLNAGKEIFASGSSDKSAKVWQLRSCAVVCSFNNHPGGVYSVALSHNEKKLYTGSIDKSVRVWDIDASVLLVCLQVGDSSTPSSPVTSLSFDKDYLLCACGTGMQMLDCKTFDWFEFYHEVHQEKVESVRLYIQAKDRGYDSMISLKGRIVTSGKDGKVKVWDLWRRKPIVNLSLLEESSVNFVQFDDVKIVCACHDGFIRIVNFN